jgi:hypothetical protein
MFLSGFFGRVQEGEMTVANRGSAEIRLRLEPSIVEAFFCDSVPQPCCSHRFDAVNVRVVPHHPRTIIISWDVSEPRIVKWVAKKK